MKASDLIVFPLHSGDPKLSFDLSQVAHALALKKRMFGGTERRSGAIIKKYSPASRTAIPRRVADA